MAPKKKIAEFDLTQLDGIGKVRADKLRASGISTLFDLLIRGSQELSVITDMDRDGCTRLIEKAKVELRNNGDLPPGDIHDLSSHKRDILKLKTGSKEMDDMLGGYDFNGNQIPGGVESQAITEVYGQEGAGKTQFGLTLTAMTLGAGHGVFFIDCEGTFDEDRFKDICKARKINPDMSKFLYMKALDTDTIMMAVDSFIKDIIENDVKLVYIDGAIGKFRAEFDQGRGDLNVRQNRLKPFFLHLSKMADYLNIAIVVTNQVMGNPDPYSGESMKAVGGYIVGHAPKYILWFKKNTKNKRTITFKKSNRHAMYDIVVYLNKEGISDTEEYKEKKVDDDENNAEEPPIDELEEK